MIFIVYDGNIISPCIAYHLYVNIEFLTVCFEPHVLLLLGLRIKKQRVLPLRLGAKCQGYFVVRNGKRRLLRF